MAIPMAAALIGSSVIGAVASSSAAKQASKAQVNATNAGIAAQQNAQAQMQQLLNPYVQAGNQAMPQYQNLLGMGGAEAQQAAVNQIANNPLFGQLVGQGESALLQNASATGGLRGGNTAGALAQYRPQMLNQQIQQQMQHLAGLTQMGQNAAAGVGTAGMATANNVSDLLNQQGAAKAGNALAQGNVWGSLPASILSQMTGMQKQGVGMGSIGKFVTF